MDTILYYKPEPNQTTYKKAPKLGRYDRVKRDFEKNDSDQNKFFIDVSKPQKPKLTIKFVDLFSGAGGISCGLQTVGYEPILSVELIEIASATHRRNFPRCKHFCGDIHKFYPAEWLSNSEVEDIRLVVGGPPCQGFSVAGKRDPNDPRNRLFYEFIRVVADIKPWYVVMENVPGILTMKNGAVYTEIIKSFHGIGYKNVSVSILESATYGVPQIRPRAIFIANRLGLPNYFPKPMLTENDYVPIEVAIRDLPPSTTIPEINHEWTKHSKKFTERISKVPPGGSLYESYFDAFKRQYPGLPSMTIKENHGGTHIHPYLNRCISAREMARLQTFPDSFMFEGTMKKAMWQIGNAVPPKLAQVIGHALIPAFNHIAFGTPLPNEQVDLKGRNLSLPFD